MSKFFYSKLAFSNIRKNLKIYLPYILTSIVNVAMYFIIASLSQNSGIRDMAGGRTLTSMLATSAAIAGIFSIFFLIYTNSFIVKRRKKEFGLYNILGMEKKHISLLIFLETVFIAIVSIALGLAIGLILNKLMFLSLLSILKIPVAFTLTISFNSIIETIVLFCGIFLLILVSNLFQIYRSNPIELLKGGNVGEKEPKTKWVITILGLICLACGYGIAIGVKSPALLISLFFVAVILVIIGTDLLFTSGSIALLKCLRKNKKYYYKSKHFISISGMMYRMKQNAVGLANICILSTAVLVMISSTLSLYMGMEGISKSRHPKEFLITSQSYDELSHEKTNLWLENSFKEQNVVPKDKIEYKFLEFSAIKQDDFFNTDPSIAFSFDAMNNMYSLFFLTVDDYNRIQNTNYSINSDEIIIYSNRKNDYSEKTLKVFDKSFNVKEKASGFIGNGQAEANVSDTHYIIVKDISVLQELEKKNVEAFGEKDASNIKMYYGFDIDGDDAKINSLNESLLNTQKSFEVSENHQECRTASKTDMYSLYGGIFFIGIFLGILFVMATILIIYYKQISEGYDDKQRFEIMKKVGMSHKEIKKSIRSQVLTVFFLPLIAAGIHIVFAFPAIKRLLLMFNLTNVPLFVACTIGCFLVFSIFYAIVYAVTARTYYKIVE